MFTCPRSRVAALVLISALLPWQAVALLAAPRPRVCPLKRVASECTMVCHRARPVASIPTAPSCHRAQDAGEEPADRRACFAARRCSGSEGAHHWVPEAPYLFASVGSVQAPSDRVPLAGSPSALPALADLPPPSPPPRHLIALH